MKAKKMLRFYFFAESLNRTLDAVILKSACAVDCCGEAQAERICSLIGEKSELERLWSYLDTVISGMGGAEVESLKEYAALRCGIKKLGEDKKRQLKRAAVKFTRRARRLDGFAEGEGLVGKYYCLLYPAR